MIKVMIVDDHNLIRYGIVRSLRDIEDITVIAEAESGEDALNQLEQQQPDVILLDIEMPGIGGVETLRTIQRLYPQIHIIMLTAHNTVSQSTRIIKMGVSG